MNIFRWLIFIPLPLLVAVIINTLLGLMLITLGFQNQTFLDGESAFVFSFMFVFSGGFFAPSKRKRVAIIFFGIIAFLAILSFVFGILGVYTSVEMETPNRLIPVLQILGAFCAVFLFIRLTARSTTPK